MTDDDRTHDDPQPDGAVIDNEDQAVKRAGGDEDVPDRLVAPWSRVGPSGAY